MKTLPKNRFQIDIVEGDRGTREQIVSALKRPEYRIREYDSSASFLAEDHPDRLRLLIVGSQLPGPNGLEVVEPLAERHTLGAFVAVPETLDVPTVIRLLDLGAIAIRPRPFSIAWLRSAVERAYANELHRQSVRNAFDDLAARVGRLSHRERTILDAIAQGRLNKVIAGELRVSVRTVESDRSSATEKLGARTTGEAIARYARHQILESLMRSSSQLSSPLAVANEVESHSGFSMESNEGNQASR